MAKDWESFKKEYSEIQAKNAYFRLGLLEKEIQSPIERIMSVILKRDFEWAIMADRSELKHQVKIGKYTIDFLLTYLSDLGETVKFVIECDGHDYHERTKEQAAHDKKRDRFFTERGYIVLRFTGSEIVNDYENLTQSIYAIIVRKDGVVGCG